MEITCGRRKSHSRSSWMKGATKPPAAASTWMGTSHPFSSFSFTADHTNAVLWFGSQADRTRHRAATFKLRRLGGSCGRVMTIVDGDDVACVRSGLRVKTSPQGKQGLQLYQSEALSL